jgi:hypothetical protein
MSGQRVPELVAVPHLRRPGTRSTRQRLRDWVVAFTVAYATTGGVKRHAYSDELACVAAWDALHMLIAQPPDAALHDHGRRAGRPPQDLPLPAGYGLRALKASMDEYWIQIGSAIRQVAIREPQT